MTTTLDAIQQTVDTLSALGVRPGMRVGLCLPHQATYAVIVTACWRLRAVAVPLSTRYKQQQMETVVKEMGCGTVVVDRPEKYDLSIPVLTLGQICDDDHHTFGGILWEDLNLDMEQEATLVLTSGSMGRPKGVLHTLANHYYSALGSHENIPFDANDVWLVSLPLYHVGGLSLIARSLLYGGTLRFPQDIGQIDLDEHPVTHLSLVPTQLKRLMSDGESCHALQRLKAVLIGGAPCLADLVTHSVESNIPIHITYGLTETASQVATSTPKEAALSPGCCGQALAYCKLRIAEDGEILVGGRTVCKAIVSGGKMTDPLDEEGWFHTGDYGRLDAEGRLTVLGRQDAVLISGGENIQPEEIEQALLQLPSIEQCLVVSIPDEQYGQRPAAFVRVLDNKHVSRSELLTVLQAVERFKRPDYFFYWPTEQSDVDKPDRTRLETLARQWIQSDSRSRAVKEIN